MADRDPRAVARDAAVRELRPLEATVQTVVQEALDDVAARFARDVTASSAPRHLTAQGVEPPEARGG